MARAQDTSESSRTLELSFFSGHVEDFTAEMLSVSRELASRKREQRTFLRTPETVIRGSLKKGVKVTVAYTAADGTFTAHRVQVRD